MARPVSSTRTGRDSRSYADRALEATTSEGSRACGSGRAMSSRSMRNPSRSASWAFSARVVTKTIGSSTLRFCHAETAIGGSATGIARGEDLVERDLGGQTLEREEAELGDLEAVADGLPGLGAHDDVAGLRDELLEPRGD